LKRSFLAALLVLVGVVHAGVGARYLVITADALYGSILPLAAWKQATGLETKVVRLSEVGTDTGAIKNYIKNAYTNWPLKPEYVLLVGSPSLLPARLYYDHGRVYLSSDNIYGDMIGDFGAELAVGRLPASTAAQLDVMVAKILMYEKTPDLTDSVWMRRLTTVVREGGDPDDTVYWNNIRNAARKTQAAGFVNCDSFSYLRGDSSSDVMRSLNTGSGLVLYRGTANGNWYQPFELVQPDALTSTNKLPLVCSVTCQTVTLDPYDPTMLGDWFMTAGTLSDLHGAVAFFGNTHPDNQVAQERGAIARGFFDGLFAEGIWKLGLTMLRAKAQLKTEFPAASNDYRGFSLLGDPELGIWTATPQALTVEHPAHIPPGAQTLPVMVTVQGMPVESAQVCASLDTLVYTHAYADSTGCVQLMLTAPDTGSVRLVVTGKNLLPYDALIPIVLTATAEPSTPQAVGLTLSVTPSPCRTSARFSFLPGARDRSPLTLSIFNTQGCLMTSMSPVIVPFELLTSALVPGAYFVRLSGSGFTATTRLVVAR
jgi:hypothetical protein